MLNVLNLGRLTRNQREPLLNTGHPASLQTSGTGSVYLVLVHTLRSYLPQGFAITPSLSRSLGCFSSLDRSIPSRPTRACLCTDSTFVP